MTQSNASVRTPSKPTAARKILLGVLVLLAAQGAFSLANRIVAGQDDIAHPLIHLASGSVGLLLAHSPRSLARFMLGFGATYLLAFGVGGATGVLDVSWLPLGTADHIFHVAVVAAALLAASVTAPPARD